MPYTYMCAFKTLINIYNGYLYDICFRINVIFSDFIYKRWLYNDDANNIFYFTL